MNENYAIKTLEEHKHIIETALTNWELDRYPEARNLRDKRLNDINEALKKIK